MPTARRGSDAAAPELDGSGEDTLVSVAMKAPVLLGLGTSARANPAATVESTATAATPTVTSG
jgi:hypothetical protein